MSRFLTTLLDMLIRAYMGLVYTIAMVFALAMMLIFGLLMACPVLLFLYSLMI